MTCSVVASEGDYRHNVRVGSMEFNSLVLFTNPPPLGEDYFTVVAKKSLLKLPLGVIPDGRMSDAARLKSHFIEFKSPKGRTPKISLSYVFSRIERGTYSIKKTAKKPAFYLPFKDTESNALRPKLAAPSPTTSVAVSASTGGTPCAPTQMRWPSTTRGCLSGKGSPRRRTTTGCRRN